MSTHDQVTEDVKQILRRIFVVEPAINRARAVEAKARRYLDHIHPSGANTIHWWLAEMRDVACEGDRAEVERLVDMIERKLTLERLWQIQNKLTYRHDHHPRLACRLHGQLGHATTAGWLKELST